MTKRASLPSLTGALSKEFAWNMRCIFLIIISRQHRALTLELWQHFCGLLCFPGGLRGPSNLCPGIIGRIICGCPLLDPFCGASPFGIFRLPVLICLKGVSLGIPLLGTLPFRRCGGAPLLNILRGGSHRCGGVFAVAAVAAWQRGLVRQ
jgi:hypothetical protein